MKQMVSIAMVLVFMGLLVTAGSLWVFAQEDSDGSEDEESKWQCSNPPPPSLSVTFNPDVNDAVVRATWSDVTYSGHYIGYEFAWTGGGRSDESVERVPRGTRSKTVYWERTYGAKVRTVAERSGTFCYSDFARDSVDVVFDDPPPPPPRPTATSTPTLAPDPDPPDPPDPPALSLSSYRIAATAGEQINSRLSSASGGTTPYTYSIVGSLPSGLSFSASTRRVTGATSTVGTTSRTYRVTDGDGTVKDATLSIAIAAATPPNLVPSLPSSIGPYSRQGSGTISTTLPAASSGNTPLTYSASESDSDGYISYFSRSSRRINVRISSAPATVTVTYTVEDANGDTDSASVNFKTRAVPSPPPPPPTEPPSTGDIDVGATLPSNIGPYSKEGTGSLTVTLPAATSGNAPLTYSVEAIDSTSSGRVSSFNASTRAITVYVGSAPQTFRVRYKVTDSDGDFDSAIITFNTTLSTPPVTAITPQFKFLISFSKLQLSSPYNPHRYSVNAPARAKAIIQNEHDNVDMKDFEFKVNTQPSTTNYMVGAQGPCPEGDASTFQAETSHWFEPPMAIDDDDLQQGEYTFGVTRCGVGQEGAHMTLLARRIGSAPGTTGYQFTSQAITQGWHVGDHVLSYHVDVESPSGTRPSSYPDDPPHPSLTSRSTLTTTSINSAHLVWQNVGTGLRFHSDRPDDAELTILGYWNQGAKNDPKCRDSVACFTSTDDEDYPHFAKQTIYLEFPPQWGRSSDSLKWTTSYAEATDPDTSTDFLFMPDVMIHEVGHALGMWHSGTARSVMGGGGPDAPADSTDPHREPTNYDEQMLRNIYGTHGAH